ncbi:MbtH family NRPS accessory protein [Streptomyces mobaraensis NBRC 13819 = DSM 40847]|uniref:MbtH-like protein n=1 Tax=Streptomyces mobaraensis (strain ATCC 29032 / DSM 40847 / JCM 4168 / NBRC 13819 / NCIMB 11159 / IPCR 16-22) TaxID=1223523 RepID=M3C9W0_STRM1|nr:MbtH family NRPS accessory protein [Streptomyces mobaraensis]EMF00766.1 MbtH-like protein [Streptomyces mobaraensis NBRC 13819 = DSM 40847]QTT76328.1 MbtH family NRPS accessory protein [Streptomyces mobaraensis NBRC 13819 = DSM 40847]
MSDNPFDRADTDFLVLVNAEEQRSLWPAHIAVPAGWTVEHPAAPRQTCLDHIDRVWTDLRPASLRAATGTPAQEPAGPATVAS